MVSQQRNLNWERAAAPDKNLIDDLERAHVEHLNRLIRGDDSFKSPVFVIHRIRTHHHFGGAQITAAIS